MNIPGTTHEWDYAYDEDHARVEGEPAVCIEVRDEQDRWVNSLGGITLESLQVSDHGNVNLSPEDEQYLAGLAARLVGEGS